MITAANGCVECDTKTLLNANLKPEGVFWFAVDSPSKELLQRLEDLYEIHPLTVEDISGGCRDKVEEFDNYLFIVLKEPHSEQITSTTLLQISIVVISPTIILTLQLFPTLAVTFHSQHAECVAKVFFQVEQNKSKTNIKLSSDWVVYSLLNAIIANFDQDVDKIIQETEALDQLVLIMRYLVQVNRSIYSAGDENELLIRIGNARRRMTTYRSRLWNQKDILLALTTRQFSCISDKIKLYLRDVLDRCLSMEQRLEYSQEVLNGVHSIFLARISLEETRSANRLAVVMKMFSAVATIFIPLTLITGLWGMNIKIPGQEDDNLYWFSGICGFIIAFSSALLAVFKYVKWL